MPPLSNHRRVGCRIRSRDWPLGQCLNIDPCFQALFAGTSGSVLNCGVQAGSHRSARQQRQPDAAGATRRNGKVWGSLDTRMAVAGDEQAGIAWFVVKPDMIGGGGGGKVGPQSAVVYQGYVGVAQLPMSPIRL